MWFFSAVSPTLRQTAWREPKYKMLESDLRFTLDYQEDANFFEVIIEGFGDKIIAASDQEVIDFVIGDSGSVIREGILKVYNNA